ncbi:GIY-YIG nuclease family protein [Halomonas sp. LS-001]
MPLDTHQGEAETSPVDTSSQWCLYLLECQRGTYVGITNNLAKRYKAHCAGKGARYTRANPPLALLGAQPFESRAEASRAEYALKKCTAQQKRAWARTWPVVPEK